MILNKNVRFLSFVFMTGIFVVGGLLFKPPSSRSIIESEATSYTLVLDSSNGPSIASETFGTGTSDIKYVTMAYEAADDSVAGTHVKLASSGGKVYNTDIITDVSVLKAVFTGGSLRVGGANHLGEIEQWISLTSNSSYLTLPDYPYYVFYTGGTGDVTISSIQFTYSCQNPVLAPGLTLTEYDDYYEVSSFSGSFSGISIPPYYNGKLITKIGAEAFKNNTTLTGITLYNTIKEIGDSAFYGCTALKMITQMDHLETIGSHAFYNCQSLTDFYFPSSLTYIGPYAFYYCRNLSEINLRDGLTSIHEGAFSYCFSVTSFYIPSSVTLIETYAFTHAMTIETIFIPITVTTINVNAFMRIFNCTVRVQAASYPSGWHYDWLKLSECLTILWGQSV